jgi:hypothetical protein
MTTKKETQALVLKDSFPAVVDTTIAERYTALLEASQPALHNLPQLRLPRGGGTVWEVAGAEPTKELDVIVLHAKLGMQKFWRDNMDDDNTAKTPPDCQSFDGVHAFGCNSDDDTRTEHGCLTCPQNYQNRPKDENGNVIGDHRGCQTYGIFFVLRPGEYAPECLQVPATSLGAANEYIQRYGMMPGGLCSFVTRITLVPAEKGTRVWSKIPRGGEGIFKVETLAPEEAQNMDAMSRVVREYTKALDVTIQNGEMGAVPFE